MYKAVFFDWDDTLWDFSRNAYEALETVFWRFHLDRYYPTFKQYLAVYSVRNKELWDLYAKSQVTKDYLRTERFSYPLREAGVFDEALAAEMGEQFLEETATKTALLPDALEVVRRVAARYPITILSNGFTEVQNRKIERSGLKPFLSHVVLSESVSVQKPHPAIYEYALQLNGLEAGDVLMVGDNYSTDIQGAQALGIDTFYLHESDFSSNHSSTGITSTTGITSLTSLTSLSSLSSPTSLTSLTSLTSPTYTFPHLRDLLHILDL